MTRQLTITAAEWASVQDDTLWLVREGEPCATPHSCPKFTRQMCRWGGHHPPVEFVQACAPCENPTHRIGHKSGLPECRNPSELGPGMHVNTVSYVPCTDCRIELVGPCDYCGGHGAEAPGGPICQNCDGGETVTLVHAYPVGQPLPIIDAVASEKNDGIWIHVEGHGRRLIPAHYGPPESLVGKWALQLKVVE